MKDRHSLDYTNSKLDPIKRIKKQEPRNKSQDKKRKHKCSVNSIVCKEKRNIYINSNTKKKKKKNDSKTNDRKL